MTNIVFPSDIKLKVNSLKDKDGNDIDVMSVFLVFDIFDQYHNHYYATSDPEGAKSKNTYFDGEYLFVLIENYKLKGELYWKVGVVGEDESFPDGNQKTWGKCQKLNINIIEC